MKELCVRCGKETIYAQNYPVTCRRYYVEGSGQLCREGWNQLWSTASNSSDISQKPKTEGNHQGE